MGSGVETGQVTALELNGSENVLNNGLGLNPLAADLVQKLLRLELPAAFGQFVLNLDVQFFVDFVKAQAYCN